LAWKKDETSTGKGDKFMALFEKEKFHKMKVKDGAVKKHTIMIVDDEEKALESMYSLLSEDYHIITAQDGQEALDMIEKMSQAEKDKLSLIISDQKMSKVTGIELFERLLPILPKTMRIILTGYADIPLIIDAINKTQIYQFIQKPFEPEDLKLIVKRAVEAYDRQQELDEYRSKLEIELSNTQEQLSLLRESFFSDTLKNPEHFKKIITEKSKKMKAIFKYCETIANSDEPVLIIGETGTGKELIARVIHEVSNRKGKFIAANIAGFDDSLFSDTLFGHEKGSFTDAKAKREGLLTHAEDGTFFLDEIGDLQVPSQTKLLRVLQEKEFYRIGSDIPIPTNARFILATNKDLNAMKDTGEFRKDFYFRVNIHHITLPPLRERKEDIPKLVDHFLTSAAEKYGKEKPPINDKLIRLLSNYHFPGNIRELRSMIFESVCLHQQEESELSLNVFIKKIREQDGKISFFNVGVRPDYTDEEKNGIVFVDSFPTFERMKKIYAEEALRLAGTQQDAAKLSEIDIKTLRKYLKGE
jgi:DNA-binding NtrC family response regulator